MPVDSASAPPRIIATLCAVLPALAVQKELDHDDGEVTATMKVRRASVYKAYSAEIEALYR